MDCPKCGAFNETDVGSCLSCGAAFAQQNAPAAKAMPAAGLPRAPAAPGPQKQCPKCRSANSATFKFCAKCGTPLLASRPAPPPPPPPAARPAAAAKAAAPGQRPR